MVIGIASAIFAPAIAAVSLGLVGHARFARRNGRNEAFNHAGNVVAAILAGVIGDYVAYEGIFYLLAAMCAGTIVSTLFIRGTRSITIWPEAQTDSPANCAQGDVDMRRTKAHISPASASF